MNEPVDALATLRACAAATLAASERVLVITHEHPDGDAIGSSLALAHALKALGREVQVTCVDPVPLPFQFLPGVEEIRSDCLLGHYDAIVTVDCGDLKRTGMPDRVRAVAKRHRRVINIDHHQRNDLHKLASINYVNTEASSAAELMLPLIEQLGVALSPAIATCLLTGLYNDTGGFKHSNTSIAVLQQAASLMSAGASLKDVAGNVACFRTVPSLRLWGIALSRIQYHPTLKLVTSVITQEDFRVSDAFQEDLAGCVNLINTVPEARATILFYEQADGRIKASVRTECDAVDVSALANLFGGGGIKKAAGFSFGGRFQARGGGWQIIPGRPEPLPVQLPAYQPLPALELTPLAPLAR